MKWLHFLWFSFAWDENQNTKKVHFNRWWQCRFCHFLLPFVIDPSCLFLLYGDTLISDVVHVFILLLPSEQLAANLTEFFVFIRSVTTQFWFPSGFFFFYPSIIFVRERINSSFILNVRPLLICLILLNGPYCEHHPWFFTSNQVCPRGLRVGQDIVRVLSRFYLFPCMPTEIWNLHKSHYIKLHFSITNESFLCYGA